MDRTTKDSKKDLQQLDEDLDNIMLSPEQKLKLFQAAWWLKDLHKAHLIVKYWKVVISQKE
eukprot:457543-Ditylum_brightwellii.AAC.1